MILMFIGASAGSTGGALKVARVMLLFGPGLAKVGPLSNYGFLHPIAKWTLSFLMLAGRLEIFTVLVMFSRSFWRR